MSNYPRLDSTGLTTLLNSLASAITQGHKVVNSSGTELTQRKKLKFANATITDDSANNTTVVSVGSSQVDTMPVASSSLEGTILQYIGVTTNTYVNGYFYECVEGSTAGTYEWTQKDIQPDDDTVIQVETLPTASASLEGTIYQFVGTTGDYINGYFYKCVEDEEEEGEYLWQQTNTQPSGGSSIQVDTMPAPVPRLVGTIYQYVGATGTYTNGYFYQCQQDEYEVCTWEPIEVQEIEAGNFAKMSQSDVNDIKAAVSITPISIPQAMSSSDVADIKDAFSIDINYTSSASQIQYETMPLATADKVGWIIQYTGATDLDYINGYFYQCVNNSGTYSWVEKDVMEGGSGGLSQEVIADEFDASTSYAVGDYCTRRNILYKFNTSHTGAWDDEDVDEINVMDQIPQAMSQSDVNDIKGAVSITPIVLPEVMSASDVQAIKDAFTINRQTANIGEVPVGTIIEYLGVSAPTYYLECDGSTHNIADYQLLADHIETQFGSVDYFGGDGETTFAVPTKTELTDSIYCIYCGE